MILIKEEALMAAKSVELRVLQFISNNNESSLLLSFAFVAPVAQQRIKQITRVL